MRVQLFDWAPSPFCLKVRMVLDYKGIAYERVPVLGPRLFEVRRRGRTGKVPAIDIDGRLVTDSTEICHELERLAPAPRILPVDPREWALCHVLEDWADEALYFIGLHFQWLDAEGRPMVAQAFGKSLFGRLARVFYQARIRRQVKGQGTGRKPAERIEGDLERELEAIEALLAGSDYLLGKQPALCDFAVAAQLVYLSRPPKSRRALERFPRATAYLERMRGLRTSQKPSSAIVTEASGLQAASVP
jgi:glutathione S-transferase